MLPKEQRTRRASGLRRRRVRITRHWARRTASRCFLFYSQEGAPVAVAPPLVFAIRWAPLRPQRAALEQTALYTTRLAAQYTNRDLLHFTIYRTGISGGGGVSWWSKSNEAMPARRPATSHASGPRSTGARHHDPPLTWLRSAAPTVCCSQHY